MSETPRKAGNVEYYSDPDAEVLLQKIVLDPKSDELRLRLAHLLQESELDSDQARAELINCQLAESAAMQLGLQAKQAPELRFANSWAELNAKRIERLLATYEHTWLQPLDRNKVQSVSWDRGVPAGLVLSGEVFTHEAPNILSQAPTVDALTVLLPREGVTEKTVAAFQQEILTRIQILRLIGPWGTEAARAVAGSPHMGNVSGLHLADTQLGFAGIGSLLSSRTLTGLRTLTLSGNRIDENLAIGLLRVPNLPPALRELILTDCGIDDDTAVSLAANSLFSTLHRLDLRQNPLSPDGISVLLASEALINVALQVDLENVEQPDAQEIATELWERELAVQAREAQLAEGV